MTERRCDSCRYGIQTKQYSGSYRGDDGCRVSVYDDRVICHRYPKIYDMPLNHWCFEFRSSMALWTRLVLFLKELFA